MATSNRSGRNTPAHPSTEGAVELEPPATSAIDAISEIEQVGYRLNALLTVVEYAINAHRVLDDFSRRAQFDPPFSQALMNACSTWCDPDASGEVLAALVQLLGMSSRHVRDVQESVEPPPPAATPRGRSMSAAANTIRADTALDLAPELRIEILPDEWVRYRGTAAQLQAEGFIPNDFEWPPAAAHKRWEANGFDYWLRRERPEGHRGPMRTWLQLDNWVLQVDAAGRDYQWRTRKRLESMEAALLAEYCRHTPAVMG